MVHLATPYQIKGLSLKNRIVMAPMCQYSVSSRDGKPNDWHFVHYVSRAIGGVGLIIIEMTDVEPDGRITDYDLGLWSDDQIPAFQRIIDAVHQYDAKIGIQIAHAGRKAEDAPTPVGPSSIPFSEAFKKPRALTTEEVREMVQKYQAAARRAVAAGVDTIEIHGAHGYLIHQFHSPKINQRTDEYGQDLARFGVEVIQAIKEVMPENMPLLMRISAVEYWKDGYTLDHAIDLCRKYRDAGVDVFHISSGGESPVRPKASSDYPGYQVPYARAIKEAVGVPVIAVGNLDDPRLAEAIIANNDADLVAIARGLLRDPYWPIHAIQELGGLTKEQIPKQYQRAF